MFQFDCQNFVWFPSCTFYNLWQIDLMNYCNLKITCNLSPNLRYATDTTLMAEIEEELKSLLMKVKEEREKAGLKLTIKKTKIISSGPITS